MLKYFAFVFTIVQLLIILTNAALPEEIVDSSDECVSNSLETALYCRGSRAMRNVLNNLSKTDKPLVIVRGLEIVPSPHFTDDMNKTSRANATDEIASDSFDTFLGRFSRYLRTHELNIKFSDLMAAESDYSLARDLELNGIQTDNMDEARKKDKGTGMVMMLALMFSKMMAVMGLGGIGALAMKALGVAMAALMMAAIVGVKSLGSQGHESTHSVQYVTADGHHHKRRRRSNNYVLSTMPQVDVKSTLPLVYRGWRK